MSVGALTSFVIYTLYVSSALGSMSTCYAELQRAEGAGARVFSLLRRTSAIESQGGAAAEAAAAEAVAAGGGASWGMALRGVRFAFHSRTTMVLDGIDIEVLPG